MTQKADVDALARSKAVKLPRLVTMGFASDMPPRDADVARSKKLSQGERDFAQHAPCRQPRKPSGWGVVAGAAFLQATGQAPESLRTPSGWAVVPCDSESKGLVAC